MPKGNPRDAKTRADDLDARIEALRNQKSEILVSDRHKKKKDKEDAAKIMGLTIMDDDQLTPQEMAVISKILARRKGPEPKKWNLLAPWLLPPSGKPHLVTDPLMDAAAE